MLMSFQEVTRRHKTKLERGFLTLISRVETRKEGSKQRKKSEGRQCIFEESVAFWRAVYFFILFRSYSSQLFEVSSDQNVEMQNDNRCKLV